MPKVLFLTDSLLNGGAERQLALLAKSLPDNWESRVWSMDGGPFADVIRCNGVHLEIHKRSWRWDLTPALSLWRLVKTWRPEIIHSYGYMSTLAVLPVARLFGMPLVDGTIRQANVPQYRGRLMKWSLQWANRVIANSQAGLKAFGVDEKRGRVVYNGFDLKRLGQYPYEKKRPTVATVIMVGRMVPEKDYPTLIKAARLLVGRGNEWRFIAMGAGVLRESFMQQAEDLIQKEYFEFPEPNLEVLPYVAKSDLGVLMTSPDLHDEGISNAIIEYMACALPVVCSASGGNQELVIDGETGYLIEPGNAAALAEKLIWLKQNPVVARKMGLRGKERIDQQFTTKNLVDGTLSVYREILGS
jgi:glycosyltransferase involved in cell wall biosynthesis